MYTTIDIRDTIVNCFSNPSFLTPSHVKDSRAIGLARLVAAAVVLCRDGENGCH